MGLTETASLTRGDFVTVALQGEMGKPRPALVIQTDLFEATTSVTVLPVTSTLIEAPLLRVPVEANPDTGLRAPSQIMIDKIVTVPRSKLGQPFGHLDDAGMLTVTRALMVFLGIGT